MKKTESYNHILRYTGLFGGVQGLNILVGIVRNKLVAMILGPNGVGLISLFNSTIKLVSDSTNFGISISAIKNISEDLDSGNKELLEEHIKLVRSLSFAAGIMGMIICVLLSPFLSKFTFSWDGHTFHFILLSPIVALLAITGGELAILKGLRELKSLAVISVYNVLGALTTTVPLYYFFHEVAIVPSLVLIAFIQLVLTIGYSYRLYPLKLHLKWGFMRKGFNIIRLGLAFVLAGTFGSGADFLIRSYINNVANIETVGLYNAGYMMSMTYVGLIFASLETDFFPRLSGAVKHTFTFNRIVSRQIEVTLLLISPLLVVFSLCLPILIPLLYSGKFIPALGMAQAIVIAMYFRALKLPIQYIPLAKGDSISYLLLETIYDVLIVALVILFFNHYGLAGTGWGITAAGIVDFIIVLIYARIKYKYKPGNNILLYSMVQIPIGILVFFCTKLQNVILYWGVGIMLALISGATTISILKTKTSLWNSLTTRIKSYMKHYGEN
nr:oligosaccharide flippase family protein [uncultured Prevotella sp.]